MLSTSALLRGNVALAGGSQKTICEAQRVASNLKILGDSESDRRRQQTSRLVATDHNISDVDWLQSLNEQIAWLQGDPIHEISNQLRQRNQAGIETSELHIFAHGRDGEIKLGNTLLTKQYLKGCSPLLQEWKLEAIYLWSCGLGKNTILLSTLESLTGAEVFASKNIIDRDNTRIDSDKGNRAYLEQIIKPKEIEAWSGNLMAPANSYVTVHTGHIDSGPTDYFRYYGDGDNRNGAGVAILQSMPWWDDADLAEQWALNSNYASPNLNIDGGTGGDEEQVAFAYDFYLWGEARNTRYKTKRKPDDYHNYGGAGGDEVGQHWSGGYAVDFSTFSGITINQTGTTDGSGNLLTTEAGGSSTFTVVLDTAPTANVTVTITGLKTQEGSLDTDTLTFTTANWDTPQTVTVTGVDDSYDNGDYTYSLIGTASNTGDYAGTERAATTVKNVDDDTNGVTIAQTGTTDGSGNLLTTEAGGSSTLTVVLDAQPSANVTVAISGNDATENSLSTDTLTFTTGNWNTAQTVTVTGENDDVDDGDITTTLTATANSAGGYSGESTTTTVKNTDDDTNGVTVAQTGTTDGSGNLLTTEAGGSSTYTVVLDAEPTADVTVTTTGNDATENSLSTDALTFTAANWNTAQTVIVNGVDDDIVDGDITTTLTTTASSTGGYDGNEISTVTVKNIDNDNVSPSPTPSPAPSPSPNPVDPEPSDPFSPTASKLTTTADGNGLTISGSENSGTWVRLQTNYSNADLQNSLQLISSKHGLIGAIGALSKGKILGSTEIFLEHGESLSFAMQSNNNSLIETPNLKLVEQNASWQLDIEDGDSNADNDFNDLGITISAHNACQCPEDYQIAQQQKQITDGLFDLRNVISDSIDLQISVHSSSGFNNRLAFVRLDDDANNLSFNGISASDETAFKDAITGALIDPASERIELQGESSKTVTWNLNKDQFGLYAPVLITEENEIITVGSSSFQNRSPLLKSIGQNHFGFEDTFNSNDVDFDYNDLTFKMTVL